MNLGQLVKLVRADFLVDAKGLNKMRGKPFQAEEIEQAVLDLFLAPTPGARTTKERGSR
jgi:2-oxoglutarate ferredoxin oxidoreductase subunit alpha